MPWPRAFSTLERELEGTDDFESQAGAALAGGDYIDGFYNLQPRHSALDYTSPVELELIHSANRGAAWRNRPPDRIDSSRRPAAPHRSSSGRST